MMTYHCNRKYPTKEYLGLRYVLSFTDQSEKPHPNGITRYDNARNPDLPTYIPDKSQIGKFLETGHEGIGMFPLPDVRFEFTNPDKPNIRAFIERSCDGTIYFRNYVNLGIDLAPFESHKKFFHLLMGTLSSHWMQQGKANPKHDIYITPLCSDLMWDNNIPFAEIDMLDLY